MLRENCPRKIFFAIALSKRPGPIRTPFLETKQMCKIFSKKLLRWQIVGHFFFEVFFSKTFNWLFTVFLNFLFCFSHHQHFNWLFTVFFEFLWGESETRKIPQKAVKSQRILLWKYFEQKCPTSTRTKNSKKLFFSKTYSKKWLKSFGWNKFEEKSTSLGGAANSKKKYYKNI